MKKIIVGTLLGILAFSALAEDATITTGRKGGTYNDVCGLYLYLGNHQ